MTVVRLYRPSAASRLGDADALRDPDNPNAALANVYVIELATVQVHPNTSIAGALLSRERGMRPTSPGLKEPTRLAMLGASIARGDVLMQHMRADASGLRLLSMQCASPPSAISSNIFTMGGTKSCEAKEARSQRAQRARYQSTQQTRPRVKARTFAMPLIAWRREIFERCACTSVCIACV